MPERDSKGWDVVPPLTGDKLDAFNKRLKERDAQNNPELQRFMKGNRQFDTFDEALAAMNEPGPKRKKGVLEQVLAKIGLDTRSAEEQAQDEFEMPTDPAVEANQRAKELKQRADQILQEQALKADLDADAYPAVWDQFMKQNRPRATEQAMKERKNQFLNAVERGEMELGYRNNPLNVRENKMIPAALDQLPVSTQTDMNKLNLLRQYGMKILRGGQ